MHLRLALKVRGVTGSAPTLNTFSKFNTCTLKLTIKANLSITDYSVSSSVAPAVLGASVGVVCSVCFLIIGVLIGVLATVTSHKCKKASHKGQSAAAPTPSVYVEEESQSGQLKVHKKDNF